MTKILLKNQPMKNKVNLLLKFLFFLIILLSKNLNGQENNSIKYIDSIFLNNKEFSKEIVYVHLNKSIYLKGEDIGFTAYCFNEKNKYLSELTSNLYCAIYDDDKNLIKKQLIKVQNGIASGVFQVDSDFKQGNYIFKAYTSWMLNFSKQNFFTDSFEVIDSENSEFILKKRNSKKVDIQILPESGHLLSNVTNTLGIIVKDSLGYGVPNLTGKVLEVDNSLITSFKLNKFGIGRFSMKPKRNKKYKVVFNNAKNLGVSFGENLKTKGLILKINTNKNNLFLNVVTNKTTLPFLRNKNYTIVYKKRGELMKMKVNYSDNTIVTKKIPLDKLETGINVFTLLDENDNAVAERIFFNYYNLSVNRVDSLTQFKTQDTIYNFKFSFREAENRLNNVSISVLTKETKAYKKHSNIIANVLIKPYIKGYIEQGGYYFTNITSKKKYDLDNLLITQGWSSYNWKGLFNSKRNFSYPFENGISAKINLINQKDKETSLFIHSLSSKSPELVTSEILKGNKGFYLSTNLFPINNEKLLVSKITRKNGKLSKVSSIYTQFFPSSVPETLKSQSFLISKNNFYATSYIDDVVNFRTLNKKNYLKEVVVKTNLKEERIEKIKSRSQFRILFPEKGEEYLTLAEFINLRGGLYSALDMERSGELVVFKRSVNLTNKRPILYLDGVRQLKGYSLYRYSMQHIDYVEFNFRGFGERPAGSAGALYIYSKPFSEYADNDRPTVTEINFPVTFTSPKKFYVPKYGSYSSIFYKNYGVVQWFPINTIDKDGKLMLKCNNIKADEITFFIEGVTKEGNFIFDKKTVSLKKKNSNKIN